MDPNNIHSQSSSLLGLLHSQQGSVYHENFPHESFHGRINFGDSQPIPSFSSQPSQVPPVARAGGGEKRKNVETTTQPSTTDGVIDVEWRPEGIKAAKARRNGGKGKSVSDYASVWEMKKEDWEMKKEDLERKERLSKLAILDTLLAKTEPLSEAEEAVKNKLLADLLSLNPHIYSLCMININKMGRYSYSQPSQSEDMFGNNSDSEYSETEDLIRRDQAELSLERRSSVIYPPQPEVEFGFPQVCYCGSPPQLVPSRSINGQGRLVYTCE
ncbi:hypothetical protein Bca52824_082015 [Brassica carinata]|uniref:Uncharacterized protein n=1 Tax=Brassica carinata TaxID=52824 RepID=A0A8X7TS55_BRACI|nr:hypothetical protein Bca52824_082015 [Brassica carinata]